MCKRGRAWLTIPTLPMLPDSLTRRSSAEKSSPEGTRITNNPAVSLETAHSTVQLGAEAEAASR